MPLVIFRLDSSKILGSGHVQRCIALANYLREKSVESIFVCKNFEGNFGYLIERENYKTYYISPHLNQEEDAKETCAISNFFSSLKAIVIDNYALSSVFESSLRKLKIKIMVIDDLMDRYHDCDILLDQNYKTSYKDCYTNLVPSKCRLLLGPKYSLLRPSFYQYQKTKTAKLTKIQNIFVFFGGSDPTGETLRFLSTVDLEDPSFYYHVMVSRGNLFLEQIRNITNKSNYALHIDPSDVANLMSKCDFFLGSGGTITWERMSMGLSGLVVAVADNQISGAQMLHNDHLHWYMGECKTVDYRQLPSMIKKLTKSSLDHINWQRKQYLKILGGAENLSSLIKLIIE